MSRVQKGLNRERRGLRAAAIVLTALMLLNLFPFFIALMNSFKSSLEIATNILGWPASFSLNNYVRAWEVLDYPRSFMNTLFLTALGSAGLIVFCSMTGYWISRRNTRFNRLLLALLLASMAIPFEAVMIPVVKITSALHLNNSLWGLGVCYWGLGSSMCVFLTTGAMKSIPYELEEAARIDGCGPLRTFWQIVFPLLKPTVMTYTILNVFWLWNDYLMPQLMLGKNRALYTIQLSMRSLFLEYYSMWDVALAALVLSLIPTVIFFFVSQKNIVAGITTGAIKG